MPTATATGADTGLPYGWRRLARRRGKGKGYRRLHASLQLDLLAQRGSFFHREAASLPCTLFLPILPNLTSVVTRYGSCRSFCLYSRPPRIKPPLRRFLLSKPICNLFAYFRPVCRVHYYPDPIARLSSRCTIVFLHACVHRSEPKPISDCYPFVGTQSPLPSRFPSEATEALTYHSSKQVLHKAPE